MVSFKGDVPKLEVTSPRVQFPHHLSGRSGLEATRVIKQQWEKHHFWNQFPNPNIHKLHCPGNSALVSVSSSVHSSHHTNLTGCAEHYSQITPCM